MLAFSTGMSGMGCASPRGIIEIAVRDFSRCFRAARCDESHFNSTRSTHALACMSVPFFSINSTFFRGGPHHSKAHTFITRGFEVGKIKFTSIETCRLAAMLGAGEQISAARYHSYNHALSFPSHMVFC